MSDTFAAHADDASAPARHAFPIAPSDSGALPRVVKAVYVGTGGHLALRAVDSAADVVFRNVGSGQIIDVRAAFVRATGTTAADLIGLA